MVSDADVLLKTRGEHRSEPWTGPFQSLVPRAARSAVQCGRDLVECLTKRVTCYIHS